MYYLEIASGGLEFEADYHSIDQLHRSPILLGHGISTIRFVIHQVLGPDLPADTVQDVIWFVRLSRIVKSLVFLSTFPALELCDLRAISSANHQILFAKSHGLSTPAII